MITEAQPPLEFIAPDYSPLVTRVVRSLLPWWVRRSAKLTQIQTTNTEQLVELYRQFQAGDIRFMLAFRHPSTNDPYCLAHLLWREMPKTAKAMGISLQPAPHMHFIYDRGIPLWAGSAVGWLYTKLGGTPIRRGKVDIPGLRSIRQLFVDGQFPMAAAPEGATNGHNEIVSPIEPGIAQFGFWAIDDLKKAGRSERVMIVPVGIQYHFVDQPWSALEALLSELEIDCGLTRVVGAGPATAVNDAALTSEQEASLYQRLYGLGEHLLTQMEEYYRKFYKQMLPTLSDAPPLNAPPLNAPPLDALPDANQQLANRLKALLDMALAVAEHFFDLPAKGSVTDRCRRIEQAGWERIYRDDLKQIEALSPVERGLADRIAEEADFRLWHMRLAESFVSVTGRYVIEKPTAERFAETLMLLWETVNRIQGKSTFPRPLVGEQRAQLTIGTPISVSDRWDDYQANRRQAVASLTQDLQNALTEMIW